MYQKGFILTSSKFFFLFDFSIQNFHYKPVLLKRSTSLITPFCLFFIFSSSGSSNNSSNYFGSVDSSQKSHKAKGQGSGALALNGSETLIKNVLQDPLWLLMANVDKDVMMSYQLPSRWVGRERRNRPPTPLLVMPDYQ